MRRAGVSRGCLVLVDGRSLARYLPLPLLPVFTRRGPSTLSLAARGGFRSHWEERGQRCRN